MVDPIIKVWDVKSLKELAHVLTYPLVAVAYFLQSGPTIGFDHFEFHFQVPDDGSLGPSYLWLLAIFALKSLWICALVAIADVLSRQVEWSYDELTFMIASTLFIAFGLLGIAAPDAHPLLQATNKFWFLASLVWGFACYGRLDEIRARRSV